MTVSGIALHYLAHLRTAVMLLWQPGQKGRPIPCECKRQCMRQSKVCTAKTAGA